MGCRTRANEYYGSIAQNRVQQNTRPQTRVEGNVVRKAAPVHSPAPVRLKRRKKAKVTISQKKALKMQRVRMVVLGTIAAAACICLCVLSLAYTDKGTSLKKQIDKLQNEYSDLMVYNDAREYEIASSVDLNYVIQVATQELGMVRCSSNQVVTYSVSDSEYLQQVAALPTD